MKKNILILSFFFIASTFTSCNKDWLEKKENISLIIPTTLKDMRLLLNNTNITSYDYRAIGEVSCDDYYITNVNYQSLNTQVEKNAYIWAADVYSGSAMVNEWDKNYSQVFYSNVILEGLAKITPDASTQAEYNDIQGGALFFRAKAFFDLLNLFAKQYNANTSGTDLGIPLKLSSALNETIFRSTVQQGYDRILTDLQLSLKLVKTSPTYKTDASQPSVNALLSKVYLLKGDYPSALQAANNCLLSYSTLINYNTLTPSASRPLALLNSEVILQASGADTYPGMTAPTGRTDSLLYSSYESNDIRKSAFYKSNGDGTYSFKGNYTGSGSLFTGIATDEVYLIRAECYARTGDYMDAMKDLNTLLVTRFVTGKFVPYVATDASSALSMILTERRKELTRRCLRWSDLRRLNTDPKFAVTLYRNVNNTAYKLLPNDSHYVLPIPDYVIQANGIQQNPR